MQSAGISKSNEYRCTLNLSLPVTFLFFLSGPVIVNSSDPLEKRTTLILYASIRVPRKLNFDDDYMFIGDKYVYTSTHAIVHIRTYVRIYVDMS